jgi:flagellar biosynthesis/type III secretory pathway M-ring protein FliF/YscJ
MLTSYKKDTEDVSAGVYNNDLLYRYESYYMYEGWNYMEKYTPDSLNPVFAEDEQNNLQLENKYKKLIMTALSEVLGSDRIHDIYVKIVIDLSNIASSQIARITVSVNIDGRWEIKYNEKGKPVLLADGVIEREYIPISPQDLHNINLLIQDIIGYDELRGDSITVLNIAFDRVNEFKIEDSKYFRQEKFKYILLLIIPLIIIILVVIIIKKNVIVRHTSLNRTVTVRRQ